MKAESLIISLKSVRNIADGKEKLQGSAHFVSFYESMKIHILNYSRRKNNKLLIERANELPEFSFDEIEDLLDNSSMTLSSKFSLIDVLFLLFQQARKEIRYNTRDKLRDLSSKLSSIIHIIEHPGIEDLIRNVEKEKI